MFKEDYRRAREEFGEEAEIVDFERYSLLFPDFIAGPFPFPVNCRMILRRPSSRDYDNRSLFEKVINNVRNNR